MVKFCTQTRDDHMCRACAGFYVYRARHYENNDIFPKMRADRPRLLLRWVTTGNWSVGRTVRSRPIPAGWLAGCPQQWPGPLNKAAAATGRNSLYIYTFTDFTNSQ